MLCVSPYPERLNSSAKRFRYFIVIPDVNVIETYLTIGGRGEFKGVREPIRKMYVEGVEVASGNIDRYGGLIGGVLQLGEQVANSPR
jgi:hypothetical protein